MIKRLSIIITCFMLVAILFVPQFTDEASAEETTITVRSSLPEFDSEIGLKWYYTDNNIFYKYSYGPNLKYISSRGGYCYGNCTWYACARASELLGHQLTDNFRGNASTWYSKNMDGQWYPYGTTPKVGAIACYFTNGKNHVAIVEKIVDGKIYVSESGWKVGAKPKSASNIYFHYGTPWYSKCDGYIYVLEGDKENYGDVKGAVEVSLQVVIAADDLNMRTGPGTTYGIIGKIAPGTYSVTKEYDGWYYLDNGTWVSAKYAKVTTGSGAGKATTTAATTAATTSSFKAYDVKITSKTLNMRTGPGTSYTSKGYITPGNYTITADKDGWGQIKSNGYWVKLSYTTKVEAATTTTAKATTTTATTTVATTAATTTTAAAASKAKFNIKITKNDAPMRSGAADKYTKKGTLKKNKIVGVKAIKNGYAQLSSNGYWVKLSYAKLDGKAKVKITNKKLNMRTGAGTKFKSKGFVKPGTYTITAIQSGFCKLSNGYWVSLSYVKIV